MNKLTSYLNTNKDTKEIIWKFAFLGNATIQATKYDELSELAEHENWTSSGSSKKNNILQSYISHTFDRAFELGEKHVLISDDETFSCFNTGLLTDNGEDIICLFNKFESSE